ncbi:MAG: hypothetical protein HW380_647 [Magnetococcales bacterium]|nr:hypothetical protein [Magnetococcales bacterium]
MANSDNTGVPLQPLPDTSGLRVAILIPIHNGLSYTQKTLSWLEQSLKLAKSHPNIIAEVIVIDDGSTDGSGEFIRKQHPHIHLLEGPGNLWWSGAINMGARYALNSLQTDWLVLWNNDIKCQDDYFDRLFAHLPHQDPHGLIGSKLYFLDPPDTLFSMGCLFDPITTRSQLIGTGQKDSEAFSQPRQVDWVGGMGTVLHRQVVTRIGFWDDRWFPQYAGDADYCLRAKQAGFTITVLPDLKIWNDTSSSGLPHKNRLDLFLRSFIDNKSWFNLRTQVLWVWRFGRSPRGWLNLLRLYAGYVGGFFFWKILELLGIHRKGSEKKSTPDGWLMEWIYLLLGLRLFIYNKVINRLPFAILKEAIFCREWNFCTPVWIGGKFASANIRSSAPTSCWMVG